MHFQQSTNHYKRTLKGFSLAEVAIAVAIAALGLVSVMGLMPTGLDNLRQAGESVAKARIYQQLFNELQLSDWGKENGGWDKLVKYDSERRYFDSEGTPIRDDDTGFKARLGYVAMFEIDREGVPLPGAAASDQRKDMRRVRVRVAVSNDEDFNFGQGSKLNSEWRALTITRQF